MEERMLDVHEIAKRLGCSERLVYMQMESGNLPHIRIGRRRKVAESILEKWMRGELNNKPKKGASK